MERITADEAVQMLEHFTGKRYQIGIQKEKARMRIEYPKRYMRKSEILVMKNPLLGENVLERAVMYAPESVVRKIDPRKKNSPLVFDTIAFEEWRAKH